MTTDQEDQAEKRRTLLNDARMMREIALRDARAPTGPGGAIPRSQTGGGPAAPSAPVNSSGWVEPTPLGPQPGIHWVDAQLIAADVRQRGKDKP